MGLFLGTNEPSSVYLGTTSVASIYMGATKLWPSIIYTPGFLLGGLFSFQNTVSVNGIVGLNTNGSVDTSFSVGTGFSGGILSSTIQSDGKVIAGGLFTSYNGTTKNRIIRLNTNGTLDSGFNMGTGFNSSVTALRVQTDGKILVGGSFTSYNGTTRNRIVRLNTDGTLDSGFSIGTGFDSDVFDIIQQSDGKIVAIGFFTQYNGVSAEGICRLNTDGSRDTSFSAGTGFNGNTVDKVIQMDDGTLTVGGAFGGYNGGTRSYLVNIGSTGTETPFYGFGSFPNARVTSMVKQSTGKVVLVGNFTTYSNTANRIARMNANGTADSTFTSGTGFNAMVWDIWEDTAGRLIVVGEFTSYNGTACNRIVRLSADGVLDATFDMGNGLNNITYTGVSTPTNKIVPLGSFTSYGGTSQGNFIPVNSSGSVTSSINVGVGFNGPVFTSIQQNDKKVIVGGSFSSYSGSSQSNITRMNLDGTRDTTFTVGIGFNGQVKTIVSQSNNKMIVGGGFTTHLGVTQNYITRLNSNGLRDTTFNIGTGFNAGVSSSFVQSSDGKIVVGGNFTSYSGSTQNRITRINVSGSVDSTFSIGTGFDSNVTCVVPQSGSNKILVGGNFTSYNGTSQNYITRLNTDGTRDTGFSIGTGFNGIVNSIGIQNDGKIVVGGNFTSYNGTTQNRITRLNADGSIDGAFSITTGFNGTVYSVSIEQGGKIVVGGAFSSYNGTTSLYTIRLNSDGTVDSSFANPGVGGPVYNISPYSF